LSFTPGVGTGVGAVGGGVGIAIQPVRGIERSFASNVSFASDVALGNGANANFADALTFDVKLACS
jgi:hypothetical protein